MVDRFWVDPDPDTGLGKKECAELVVSHYECEACIGGDWSFVWCFTHKKPNVWFRFWWWFFFNVYWRDR